MSVNRRRVLVAVLVILAIPLALIGATAFAVWRAAHTDDASRVDRTDVIVVLGAAQYGGEPSPVFRARLDHAKLLYSDGRAPRILVVGAGQPEEEFTEAIAGRNYLIEQGVPEVVVAAIPKGQTTLESLRAAASYMNTNRLDSAFLVSDPWHNLRIRRMASDLGIRAYASATWHSAASSQETRLPGYARETFAYLYYRLFGA
ncbi:MAG: YdcF family protein [Actinomycetota bacterium]